MDIETLDTAYQGDKDFVSGLKCYEWPEYLIYKD